MSRNVMLIMCVIVHVDGSLWLARVYHVPPDDKRSCTSKRTKKMGEGIKDGKKTGIKDGRGDKRWQKRQETRCGKDSGACVARSTEQQQ